MSILDDLIKRRLIEAVETDEAVARQWLEDARRHLEAADAIAERTENRTSPTRLVP